MDAVADLQTTKMYQFLQERSSDFAARIVTFVEHIAPILATTQGYFPLYTRHDAGHGYKVTGRLGQVLKPACFDLNSPLTLQPVEAFLLIAAAYAHDLGMTVFPGEADELRTRFSLQDEADWKTHKKLTDYLRSKHSERGGKYIQSHAKEMEVPDNLVAALDWIMKSHNLSIPELDRQLKEPFAADEQILDVRQLAAILCVADAIEFSDTRVLEGVIELAKSAEGPAAYISYRENRKHDCIQDSLALDDDGQVVVAGTFTEPEVLALAHRTFDQMEDWIRGYCDIDRSCRHPRLQIRPEPFRRRLEILGSRFERLGVRINKRSVIELISSNAVWKNDSGAAIRELIQNAVEACRFRQHHSSKADNYSPSVRVELNRARSTITVRDNGCGMSERTVLNNFLTVGSSRAKEPAYSTVDYAPIARFGVGFWSVFTVAERAHIETLSFEQASASGAKNASTGFAFDVALDELKDYTVFEAKELTAGTLITLELKPSVIMDDIFESTRRHLIAANMPLTLVLDNEETVIPPSVPPISASDLLGARQRKLENAGVQVFDWQGKQDDVEVSLAFVYKMIDSHASFKASEKQSLLSSLQGIQFSRAGVCGFVTAAKRPRLCFALERIGISVANHSSPSGFEFSLDRQSLIENDANAKYAKTRESLIHDGYRAFLIKSNSYTPKDIFRLRNESELNGGNVYDQYTANELAESNLQWPDLLCFELYPVDPMTPFHQTKAIYVNLIQLQQMEGRCWTMQQNIHTPLSDGSHISHYEEDLPALLHGFACAQKLDVRPRFIMAANRTCSMLFDADPTSVVMPATIFLSAGYGVETVIMKFELQRLQLQPEQHRILTQVQGRWAGAVYSRELSTKNGNPYVFLGRYRLVVLPSSRLHQHLTHLVDESRLIQIASLICDLQEHEQGFMPSSLVGIL